MNARGFLRRQKISIAILTVAIVFFSFDLVTDFLYEEEYSALHMTLECIVFVGVIIVLVTSILDLRRLDILLEREKRHQKWFKIALTESINSQMTEWCLTRTEKDVAWFIIKGYRFSEISEARGVQESTSRLQASSIYTKVGVSGRAEFVAEIFQPMLRSVSGDYQYMEESGVQ